MSRPSRSVSKATTVHDPLPPPPQQKRFPARRRTTRTVPGPPSLSKKQSTLTQLPEWSFSSSSSSALSRMVGLSDDDISELEEAERRPAKRRKKNPLDMRSDSQPSLTQWDRDKSVIGSGKRKHKLLEDEDGFQVWEDTPAKTIQRTKARETRGMQIDVDEQDVAQKLQAKRRPSARTTAPSPTQAAAKSRYNLRRTTESPQETRRRGANRTSTTPAKAPSHGHNLRSSAKKEAQTMNSSKLRTPSRKVLFTEIPSSQSPLSAKLSTQRSVRFQDMERSPLKERSANVASPSPSPSKHKQSRSQPSAMKMLQRIHMERVHERRKQTPPPRPPALHVSHAIEVSNRDDVPASSIYTHHPAKRKLKRVTTVQDSQYEGGDIDLDDLLNDSSTRGKLGTQVEPHYDSRETDDNEDEEPNTYDPAYSALDRDATRYMETQMQTQGQMDGALHLTPHVSNSTASGAEEILASDEDEENDFDSTVVESGRATQESKAFSARPHQPSPEIGHGLHPSEPLADPVEHGTRIIVPDSVPSSPSNGKPNDVQQPVPSAEASFITTTTVSIINIPSSPPVVHPSQVSTIVPTQASSPQRPTSRRSQWDTIETQPLIPPPDSDEHSLPATHTYEGEGHEETNDVASSASLACPPLHSDRDDHEALNVEEEVEAATFQSGTMPSCPHSIPPMLPSSPLRASLATATEWRSNHSLAEDPYEDNMVPRQHQAEKGVGMWQGSLSSSSILDFSLPPPPPMSSGSAKGSLREL